MKKQTIITIIIYLIAFGINFATSMKYPDSSLTFKNFIISTMLLLTLSFGIKALILSKKNKLVQLIIISGVCSSIFVFIASEFHHMTQKYIVLDIISGIHYPLYALFVTPLFGLNYIFNVSYGMFSGIISIFYLTGFGSIHYFLKNR